MSFEKKFAFTFLALAALGFVVSSVLNSPQKRIDHQSNNHIDRHVSSKPPLSFRKKNKIKIERKSIFIKEKKSLEKFEQWLKKEEDRMGDDQFAFSSGMDVLLKRAKKLTHQQADKLLERVISSQSSANGKILSAYLLAQAGTLTLGHLVDLVSSPLPEKKFEKPHSLDETRYMQEKSLRIMAIDSMVERAGNSRKALQSLKVVAQRVSDPTLKSYIERKIKTLNK